MFINVYLYQIGKGEPKKVKLVQTAKKPQEYQISKGEPKEVKLASKAKKTQAAKNLPKKPHACKQCDSSFIKPSWLQTHIDAVHLKLKPFKCDKCDSAYGS